MTFDDSTAFERAATVLSENDRGTYTVPTKGLYPFQWNWDSCLTALGQRHIDEARAWTEIETLAAHQWPDGMIPHIIFHVADDGYFPGPDVWQTGRPVPTSGITQPPVLGFVLRRLYEEAKDTVLAEAKARALIGAADAWHRWFYAARDPEGTGLVAILHPWESGRDNSCDWDAALARVPTDGIEPYQRRDTSHVDAAQRPHKAEYDRYLWLVQRFRGLGWDNAKLHDASPFRVVDPGFNAILIRSDEDIAALGEALGMTGLATAARARVAKARAAFERLWSEEHGQYLCLDRVTGALVESRSVGGLLPLFAGLGIAGAAAGPGRPHRRVARRDPLRHRQPRPGRSALRGQALLARAGVADRQLSGRRRPDPLRPGRGGRRGAPGQPAADRGRLRRILRPGHRRGSGRRQLHLDRRHGRRAGAQAGAPDDADRPAPARAARAGFRELRASAARPGGGADPDAAIPASAPAPSCRSIAAQPLHGQALG